LVIPELVGKLLSDSIETTIIESGLFQNSDLKGSVETLDIEGKRVDTYLIQYNPQRNQISTEQRAILFSGEVIFNRPILALITRSNQLTVKATGRTDAELRYKAPIVDTVASLCKRVTTLGQNRDDLSTEIGRWNSIVAY
jgi:hypothetical protein